MKTRPNIAWRTDRNEVMDHQPLLGPGTKRFISGDRPSLRSRLRSLDRRAFSSESLFAAHLTYDDRNGERQIIPKYRLVGPGDRRNDLRVGIFAGVHGDEESGVLAALDLIERFSDEPEMFRGYELVIYPVVNPTGYARWTRHNADGRDLNREFWTQSEAGEVRLLEQQLRELSFDGIIALHSDDTSAGLYGFVKGHQLTRHVLEPALEEAGKVLPRNFDKSIDNFQANNGIIEQGYEGILSAPSDQKPRPFEIVFETPHGAPLERQIDAHSAAVETILERFKILISEGQGI